MSKTFSFNPFTSNFDVISQVTIGTANGLSIDANQTLSLDLSSSTTTGALSSSDWNSFNSKLRYLGAWDNLVNYVVNDVVSYSNNTYICIGNNHGGQPDNSPLLWQPVYNLTFPLVAPGGTVSAPSYAFSETGNDTGMWSSGDGDISWSNNATLGMELDSSHNLNVIGTITASNFPITGSTNTFAGFDNSGALGIIPGWNFNSTSKGANVSLTYDPVVGSTTIQNFVSDFSPSSSAVNNETGFNLLTTFDVLRLNNDNNGTISGVTVGQTMLGNGLLNTQRALIVDQHSGDGSTTGTISTQNAVEIYSEVSGGTVVGNVNGITLQLNQNGTVNGDYNAFNASVENQPIGGNLSGLSFVNNCAVTGFSTLSNLTQNGSVGIDLNILSSNNQGTVGQNYFCLNYSNSGTIAQNYYGMNYVNQSSASVGNDFIGSNVNNQATVGHFFTGNQVINNNTITKGFTGYVVDNTGNVGDSSGVNLNGFNVNLHGGSVAGGIFGFSLNNSMPVTTNDPIYGLNVNNSGSGNSFIGTSISNNSNQTEQISGFNFISNGNSRTATLMDLNSTGDTTNDINGFRVDINGTAQNVNGIQVNLDGVTLTSNSQKLGLSINDGATNLNSIVDTSTFMPSGEWQHNLIGGLFHIAPGFPVSGAFGFGNNIGVTVIAEDDMVADNTLGSSSIGFSVNGLANQVGVTSGKTFDTLNWMLAGGGIASQSTGGTITNATMFRAVGLLPEGGTVNVVNMYGFKAEPLLSSVSPTNTWGVWVGDTNADNWFAKNTIIGGTSGHVNTIGNPFEIQDSGGSTLVQSDASGNLTATNLSGTNTGDQTITLSGDVAGSGTGSFSTTIQSNVVDNSKLAQMSANTIKGNNTGSTANALDLTVTQVQTLLGITPSSSGDIAETSFNAANNQSSPTDITAFLFNNANVRSFDALVSVFIDATSPFYETFKLYGIQRGADWQMSASSVGDNSGIAFSITNSGQIQYTSDNYPGFSAATIKFRAITLSV